MPMGIGLGIGVTRGGGVGWWQSGSALDLYFANSLGFNSIDRTKTTPDSILTYTSPSPKLVYGDDGVLRYAPHNLFLNSGAPATQNVTLITGFSYTVTVTGSGSLAGSSGASGTASAGSPATFVATGTTGTFTLTGSLTTIQINRSPAHAGYIPTTTAAVYSFPIDHNPTTFAPLGVLIEEQRVNLCLYSDDFTNAAWVKSNMTTAKTATGPDGVANSASTLTATAGNATALQAITSGSAARVTSMFVKRRTGTGNIDLTQDNGGTWATQTVTASWTRVSLATVTSANPTVGVRIVTSGDAVDVALFDHEAGAFITSPKPTVASQVTRAADQVSILTSAFAYNAAAGTMVADATAVTSAAPNRPIGIFSDGTNNERIMAYVRDSNAQLVIIDGGATQAGLIAGATTNGVEFKIAAAWAANDVATALDGGAVATAGAATLPTVTTLSIGRNPASASEAFNGHIKRLTYFPTRRSNADLQVLST